MSEFTKGPWVNNDYTIDAKDCCIEIAKVTVFNQGKANAHLIAAAPEMYEALMAIKNDLLERANSDSDDRKVVACGSSVWVQIQDALAKAQGEL